MHRHFRQAEPFQRVLFHHQRPVQVFTALYCQEQSVAAGGSQNRIDDRFRSLRRTGRTDLRPQHLAGTAAQYKDASFFWLCHGNQLFSRRRNLRSNLGQIHFIVSPLFLNRHDLVYPAFMPPAGKFRIQPGIQDAGRKPRAQHAFA